jgi:hypothetical protein
LVAKKSDSLLVMKFKRLKPEKAQLDLRAFFIMITLRTTLKNLAQQLTPSLQKNITMAFYHWLLVSRMHNW